ncbi:hypothetical protein RI054_41g148120 [Pseudoscourfieldia marina]
MPNMNNKGKAAAADEEPKHVDSDYDSDSSDSELPNLLPKYVDSDSDDDIAIKNCDVNFELICPPGDSNTAYYDRLGRVREVPAGFGMDGAAMLCDSDIEKEDDDEVDEDEQYARFCKLIAGSYVAALARDKAKAEKERAAALRASFVATTSAAAAAAAPKNGKGGDCRWSINIQ